MMIAQVRAGAATSTRVPVAFGELTSAAAAEPITTALGSLTLEDVRKGAGTADPPAARATFRTFDGLELELAGRKDGTHSLIAITARSTAKETAAEAEQLAARVTGWEFEIPDYKYAAIFTPLDQLLQPLPTPAKKEAAAKKSAGAHAGNQPPLTAK